VLPTSTYTYAWSNSATTANNSNLGAGNYRVTITNTANNCVKDTVFNLANSNGPTIDSVKIQNVSCGSVNDGAVTVAVSSPNGISITAFTWSNDPNAKDFNQFGLAAATYFFTVTDNANCIVTGSVTVGQQSCCPLQVSATVVQPGCLQPTGTINVNIDAQGTPPYEYSIDGTNYQSNASFANLADGNYSVYVRDAGNCADTTTATVTTASNTLAVTLTPTSPGCAGATGSIASNVSGANGNVNYLWSNAATSSAIAGLQAGNYTVTVTDAAGCSQTASATILPTQPLTVSIGNDVSFCQGESATITAPAGFTDYLWSDGNTTNTTTATASGIYSVTVTDANGCTASDALVATVFATPVIDLPTDTTVYENNPVILKPIITNGATPATYLWQPDADLSCSNCANPVANPADTITYTLAYTSANNCTSNAQITINVLKGALIYMPNVFSPNNDGNNDILFPLGVGVKSIKWKVFNRWGELIFTSEDINIGWDGTFRGALQPPGVYVYTMQVTFLNKTAKNYKGGITLIR
jgi:gliding motility-associated-like protein